MNDLGNQTLILGGGFVGLFTALHLSKQGYGIEGAKENTLPFRNREDAIALKTHLQDCLQQAQQTPDLQNRQHLLTVAIVGAGPSGVELAATLEDVFPRWYSELGGEAKEIREPV